MVWTVESTVLSILSRFYGWEISSFVKTGAVWNTVLMDSSLDRETLYAENENP